MFKFQVLTLCEVDESNESHCMSSSGTGPVFSITSHVWGILCVLDRDCAIAVCHSSRQAHLHIVWASSHHSEMSGSVLAWLFPKAGHSQFSSPWNSRLLCTRQSDSNPRATTSHRAAWRYWSIFNAFVWTPFPLSCTHSASSVCLSLYMSLFLVFFLKSPDGVRQQSSGAPRSSETWTDITQTCISV